MTDEGPDSLILRYLRGIDSKVDALRDEIRDLKSRVAGVETGLNAVRRDLVALAEADARQQASIDRMTDRLERVERRLDLKEA